MWFRPRGMHGVSTAGLAQTRDEGEAGQRVLLQRSLCQTELRATASRGEAPASASSASIARLPVHLPLQILLQD